MKLNSPIGKILTIFEEKVHFSLEIVFICVFFDIQKSFILFYM